MPRTRNEQMQQCIDDCTNCHNICVETLDQNIEMGEKFAEISHIRTLQDCARLCATSADFMLRESALHPSVCGLCADACERCADSCERLAVGDELMRECIDMCRTCARSCREMAKMAA